MAGAADGLLRGFGLGKDMAYRDKQMARQETLWGREDDEYAYKQNVRKAGEYKRALYNIRRDESGRLLSDAEIANDPKRSAAIQELMSDEIFDPAFDEGTPEGVKGKFHRLFMKQDGTAVPEVGHYDEKSGEKISEGPVTENRTGDPDDRVALLPISAYLDQADSFLAKYDPNYIADQKANRVENVKRGLADIGSRNVGTVTQASSAAAPPAAQGSSPGELPPTPQNDGLGTGEPGVPAPAPSIEDQIQSVNDAPNVFERGVNAFNEHQANAKNDMNLQVLRGISDPKANANRLRAFTDAIERDPVKFAQSLTDNKDELVKELGAEKVGAIADYLKTKLVNSQLKPDGQIDEALEDLPDQRGGFSYKGAAAQHDINSTLIKRREKAGASPEIDKALDQMDELGVDNKTKEKVHKEAGKADVRKQKGKTTEQSVVNGTKDIVSSRSGGGKNVAARLTKKERDTLSDAYVLGIIDLDTMVRAQKTGRLTKPNLQIISDGLGGFHAIDKDSVTPGHHRNTDRLALEAAKGSKSSTKLRNEQFNTTKNYIETFAQAEQGDKGKNAQRLVGRYMQRINSTPYLKVWGINEVDSKHARVLYDAAELTEQMESSENNGFWNGVAQVFGKDEVEIKSLTPALLQKLHGINTETSLQMYKIAAAATDNDQAKADELMLTAAKLSSDKKIPLGDALQALISGK